MKYEERKNALKQLFPPGTRVELWQGNGSLPIGSRGTVKEVADFEKILVEWDNGDESPIAYSLLAYV